MHTFSGWELLVILVIILLLFGVGRISKIASELGSGIRSFRKGLKGEGEGENPDNQGDANPKP
ncbi:MAG: twin-arginine translocase TatA/TatE family subunit [Chloroflexota bacterium]|jgi:sec-independent protein translocase protein TatA